ncbi:MAG: thioesterase family protein [Cellvibrionaceae bacterium]|nr:thioesterase family protein [Cellvibrionaceae bacterium]
MPAAVLAQTFSGSVQPEWIDYNGHMSEAFYVLVFGYASDGLYAQLGLDESYRVSQRRSLYTAEAHINYLREVGLGGPLLVRSQLLERGGKTLRFCHTLYSGDTLLAFTELLAVLVDTDSGRAVRFEQPLLGALEEMLSEHQRVELPEWVQRRVGQR